MNPTFTTAIRYFVDVTCQAPLRTGSSKRSMEIILKNADDIPMLQGTSLAGSFRSWRKDAKLFGSQDEKSSLMFSDLIFQPVMPVIRPRVKINGKTGTIESSSKFDVAALPKGTTGSFQMIWTGNTDPEAMAPQLEAYLSALHSGEIVLGALKANGFGRVTLHVKRRMYRMTNPEDLEAWLLDDQVTDAQEIPLQVHTEKYVLFKVNATMPELLVKSASDDRSKGGGHSIPMKENGTYFLPSSSLKGSIRGQMARICPLLNRSPMELEQLFGHANRQKQGGLAGVLRFSDGSLEKADSHQTNRIRINRLTGGVMYKSLLAANPVTAELSFEIRVPVQREAGCGLLLYALRDLGLGLYELGSGTAIGWGRAVKMTVEIQSPKGNATLSCHNQNMDLSDPDGLVAAWQKKLEGGASL